MCRQIVSNGNILDDLTRILVVCNALYIDSPALTATILRKSYELSLLYIALFRDRKKYGEVQEYFTINFVTKYLNLLTPISENVNETRT